MADKRNKQVRKYLLDASEQLFRMKEYYPKYTADANRIIILIDMLIDKIRMEENK